MDYKTLDKIYFSDKKNYENIYLSRINSEASQIFDFQIGNNKAFFMSTPKIIQMLDKIMELDSKLNKLTSEIPNIALNQYTRKCLIDEIHLTNDIEGVISTRKEIDDIISNKDGVYKNRLYVLVQKYIMLLDKEDINIKDCNDIRTIYNELVLKEINDDDKPDGLYFRKYNVQVVSEYKKIIQEGLYPEAVIIDNMQKSLDILNNSEYNYLIRIAIFHYMFGYIHPFYDGNGRTSRFISSYLLSRRLNELTSFRLSYTIKNNIKMYYRSFKIVNDPKNRGDLTPFVIIFFEIIIELINELNNSIQKRLDKLNYYDDILIKVTDKNNTFYDITYIMLQNTLFGDKGMSITDINEVLGYSSTTIRNCIKILDKKNMLRKDKESKKILYDLDLNEFNLL